MGSGDFQSGQHYLQEKIRQRFTYISHDADLKKIEKALSFSQEIYGDTLWSGNMKEVEHAFEVTELLLQLKPDTSMIIASLLHLIPQHDKNYSAKIEKEFGSDVKQLIDGFEMLRRIKPTDVKSELENTRKIFLVMAKDLRVVILKLVDRVHSLQHLDLRHPELQKQLAKETMDIYAPIAARLGIYTIKTQLEDLSFQYLFPLEHQEIQNELQNYFKERGQSIDVIKKEIVDFLQGHSFEVYVDGRIKNLYSIYRKLKLKNQNTLDHLYDVYALRIVVPPRYDKDGNELNDHLYGLLGLIHSRWQPLTDRFKDYVAVPKPNGYQSLHTAVIGLAAKKYHPTEIQIRSERMHHDAEFGVASHWLYKDLKKTEKIHGANSKMLEKTQQSYMHWLESLSQIQQDLGKGKNSLSQMKLDIFDDRIFVFTPEGEVKDLPKGATPLDFAYSIHTDLGHRCLMAKVNGSIVPLAYELKNGEIVEIVLSNKFEPKTSWLTIVKTPGAKAKIRSYFKSLDKNRLFRDGKELINKILVKLQMPFLDDELSILKQYGEKKLSYKERVTLVEDIGNGSRLAHLVLKKVLGRDIGRLEESVEKEVPEKKLIESSGNFQSSEVVIGGETGIAYRFALCCKPKKGEPIFGYLTRGNAVSIHLQKCKKLKDAEEIRIIDTQWSNQDVLSKMQRVEITLRAHDRVGLIRDIAEVISRMNINIVDFGSSTREADKVVRKITLEVSSLQQLPQIVKGLQKIRNMIEVKA